jgi:glyoxylase-like metal-dependent hydrolase (beta-lactamase superfamily II)
MIHRALAVGPLQCNCHVLADEKTKEAVIIDPGDDAAAVLEAAKGLRVVSILHTHCHFDHMGGTRAVAEATGAEILIHKADLGYYEHLAKQVAILARDFGLRGPLPRDPLPVSRFLRHGETVRFGSHALNVLHTPGHTEGSCCFHREGQLFSGDTLFAGSVGRTDLPGGNFEQEADSIRARLYPLDPETKVWPGHGPPTSIGEEREHNAVVPG